MPTKEKRERVFTGGPRMWRFKFEHDKFGALDVFIDATCITEARRQANTRGLTNVKLISKWEIKNRESKK